MKRIGILGGISHESTAVVGNFRAESRQLLLRIIEQYAVDGVILGCTELPLLLRASNTTTPLLDTLTLHVKAAVDYALN